MNSIVEVENTKNKKVFIVINHIKAIYEISSSIGTYYNIVYGDQEENFVSVYEKNLIKILYFFNRSRD